MLIDTSRSKDLRNGDDIHLATIGSGPAKTAQEGLRWNLYLRARGLTEVDRVGTGLPKDNGRDRAGWGATLLMSLSNIELAPVLAATGTPQTITQPSQLTSTLTAIARNDTARSGEAGPSTTSFRTSRRRSTTTDPSAFATSGDAVRRRALVEQAMDGVTEETDLDLHLILTSSRNLQIQGSETDRDAIARLANHFSTGNPLQPLVTL